MSGMRRVLVLLALAACGRFNYDLADAADPSLVDAATDASSDVPVDADPLQSGLVAWYPMDSDPSGGMIADASGNARHAQCLAGSTCPTQEAGRIGNAVRFFGSRCARVTYDPGFATTSAYTVAAWLWLDVDVDQVPFGKPFGSGDRNAWGLVAWRVGSTLGTGTCMESMNAAQTGHETACGPQAPLGAWFHVALRWTGQAKALFMNGTKVGERTPATASAIDNNDVSIGCDLNSGSGAFYLQGRIDELRIYDRGLTDGEIATLAQ
jgi:hypothetical protein